MSNTLYNKDHGITGSGFDASLGGELRGESLQMETPNSVSVKHLPKMP